MPKKVTSHQMSLKPATLYLPITFVQGALLCKDAMSHRELLLKPPSKEEDFSGFQKSLQHKTIFAGGVKTNQKL